MWLIAHNWQLNISTRRENPVCFMMFNDVFLVSAYWLSYFAPRFVNCLLNSTALFCSNKVPIHAKLCFFLKKYEECIKVPKMNTMHATHDVFYALFIVFHVNTVFKIEPKTSHWPMKEGNLVYCIRSSNQKCPHYPRVVAKTVIIHYRNGQVSEMAKFTYVAKMSKMVLSKYRKWFLFVFVWRTMEWCTLFMTQGEVSWIVKS